jgi:hypothetical protein
MVFSIGFIGALFLAALLQEPLQVPSDEVQASLRLEIRTRWSAEYAKKSRGRRLELADLLSSAAKVEVDSATRFVLHEEELLIGAEAGEVERSALLGARMEAEFAGCDAHIPLGQGLSEWMRMSRQSEKFASVAREELAAVAAPSRNLQLGLLWDAIRGEARSSYRRRAGLRARTCLLNGLRSGGVLARQERSAALEALVRCEQEIEKADGKAGRYTLYAGRWFVSRRDGAIAQIVIDARGKLLSVEVVDSLGADRVPRSKRSRAPKLRRKSGAGVQCAKLFAESFDAGPQRLRVERDRLFVAPEDSKGSAASGAPSHWEGVRDDQPEGGLMALGHARLALRNGLHEECRSALRSLGVLNAASAELRRGGDEVAAGLGVLEYALQAKGTKVGDGECWTLASEALASARARWSRSGYRFGRELGAEEPLRAGDILQFEEARFVRGSSDFVAMPHHTAVIAKVMRGRNVVILHQNFGSGPKLVSELTLDLGTKTSGTLKVFRPIPGE